MARIRSIKPTFFKSEDVSELPLRARLTWIGLWTHCDDQGRAKDNVRLIKGEVWPLDDVSLAEVEEDLVTLAEAGRIVRYEVDGRRYLEITNWSEHQRIQRPTESKLPAPSDTDLPPLPPNSGSDHGTLNEDSVRTHARRGGEGRGSKEGTRASAPPPHCSKHVDNPTTSPCGPCKDARLKRERWDAEQADLERQRKRAVSTCRLCDGDGARLEPGRRIPIVPYEPCDHTPVRSVS